MRPVAALALFVAILAIPNALPTGTVDECAAAGATGCQTVDVTNASAGHASGVYYVYVAGASCAPSFSASCSGRPFANPAPAVGVVGLVYQETNNHGGLQRSAVTSGTTIIQPDQAVLL